MEKGRKCDVCLVGIGTIETSSTTAKAGGLSEADLSVLKECGAVSSVCNTYYDAEGKQIHALENRCVGVTLGELKHGKIIACAIGHSKTQAIRSALKTGKLNVLMTDFDTASEILKGS